jgi:hypothetical protein
MTQPACTYAGNRDEALVTYLYSDDPQGAPERTSFAAHLDTCATCRDEVEALVGVRGQLAHWAPPERRVSIGRAEEPGDTGRTTHLRSSAAASPSASRGGPRWRQIPAWAQVAAAMLVLGASAAIAHLDVRYDEHGVTIRTGWRQAAVRPATTGASAGAAATADAPWTKDLAALEQQLKAEMRSMRTAAPASASVSAAQPVAVKASDADLMRRMRALIDESEKRQQSELALRMAELLRDVNVQRQADLAKVNRALGAVENNLGVEVLKTRQQVNLMYRASQSR